MTDSYIDLTLVSNDIRIKALDNGDGTYNLGVTTQDTASVNAAVPTSYNLTLTLANTEYSQAMPASCKGFEFQCRTENEIRFAFVTGKVAGAVAPYNTLKAGDYYYSGPIDQGSTPSTLYFASTTAGVVVSIISWL